jgi:AcrR family transcriptional regulator
MASSANEARELRILDAAAELIVHFGYDKTTVSDIAARAGVSKGAIYLHFDGKDALFEALLVRELQLYTESWLALLEKDPRGGTLAAMYKNVLYALNSRPFMAAIFRQDRRLLGNYLRKPNSLFRRLRAGQNQSIRFEFVQMMQEAGVVRRDVSPQIIAHVMNVLAFGLVGMDDVLPAEDIPPLDEAIEGIAALMDRALTPADGGNPEAGRAIVRQVVDMGRRQLEELRRPREA